MKIAKIAFAAAVVAMMAAAGPCLAGDGDIDLAEPDIVCMPAPRPEPAPDPAPDHSAKLAAAIRDALLSGEVPPAVAAKLAAAARECGHECPVAAYRGTACPAGLTQCVAGCNCPQIAVQAAYTAQGCIPTAQYGFPAAYQFGSQGGPVLFGDGGGCSSGSCGMAGFSSGGYSAGGCSSGSCGGGSQGRGFGLFRRHR